MAESKLSPLQFNVSLVNPDGTPTPYFIQLLQQLYEEKKITDDAVTNDVIAGAGLSGGGALADGPVTLTADVQAILNLVSTTRGAILYRGAAAWSALLPGAAGQFLRTAGAGADPSWAAAGGGGGGSSILSPYPSSGIDPATASAVATSPGMLMIGGFTGAATTVNGIWLPCRSVVGRICVPALYDAGLITAGAPPNPTGAALVATGPSVAMADNKVMYMPFAAPFVTVLNHYYFLSIIYSGAGGNITTMALGSARRGWYNLSGVVAAPALAPAMTNHIADFYGFWND